MPTHALLTRSVLLSLPYLLGAIAPLAAQPVAAPPMLTAQPWCQVQNLADPAGSGPAPSRNIQAYERVQFRSDGSVTLALSSTSTMSMGGMSMSSQSWRTAQYRWRLEPDTLWLSGDGGQSWTSGAFILREDAGGLLLSIDGSLYRPCR